jgi:hypothetical protein
LGQFFEINADMLHLRDELISSVSDIRPVGTHFIDKKRGLIFGGNVKKIKQLNNGSKSYILIESKNGRLGNQLYPIMVALSFFESNKSTFEKIYFKNFSDKMENKLSYDVLNAFPKIRDRVIFIQTEDEYNQIYNNDIIDYRNLKSLKCPTWFNSNILVSGYCQNAIYINEDLIRKYFEVP